MSAARESLLDAAMSALTTRAWPAVRMVDVASAAGVSRQTLYNEFGSKEGLARALVRRETDNYLAGVDRVLTQEGTVAAGPHDDAAGRVVAAAAWTLRTARTNPLVRAALTGCWNDRLPALPEVSAESVPIRAARPGVPGQRAASPGEGPLPGPAELVGQFCDRAVAALEPDWPEEELPALGAACETAARLTLSCVVAPAAPETAPAPGHIPASAEPRCEAETEVVSRLVRGAFARLGSGRGWGWRGRYGVTRRAGAGG
ncbi:TetR/AcrR family transcriptional regulator [Streptomyces halobius]|uniref:TetR/AcrR family transcriptional regulator n=1 Tax=Streptomyces halobius TaxID=2879846 RepID=A0ABY4M625_9ACTN|nr:TetR/AcrR family transcriptional regulator [Streptomyces halobius]UQA93207.1 TetR/AcrR family transcriptional regulator [Streptomyces halobius]